MHVPFTSKSVQNSAQKKSYLVPVIDSDRITHHTMTALRAEGRQHSQVQHIDTTLQRKYTVLRAARLRRMNEFQRYENHARHLKHDHRLQCTNQPFPFLPAAPPLPKGTAFGTRKFLNQTIYTENTTSYAKQTPSMLDTPPTRE